MCSNGRFVVCGGMGGDIILKDFCIMKIEYIIDVYLGMDIIFYVFCYFVFFLFLKVFVVGGCELVFLLWGV